MQEDQLLTGVLLQALQLSVAQSSTDANRASIIGSSIEHTLAAIERLTVDAIKGLKADVLEVRVHCDGECERMKPAAWCCCCGWHTCLWLKLLRRQLCC